MSGEFDGAPLVAGTVRGVRSFKVDELGRLRGPQQGTVWRPGRNDAECRAAVGFVGNGTTASAVTATGQVVATYNVGIPVPGKFAVPTSLPSHSFASCRCGFYAYADGHDAAEYGGDGTVAAVVEGWGDVMLGTRGFRASHARVLAVTIPESTPMQAEAATGLRPFRPYGFGWVWAATAAAETVYAGYLVASGNWWGVLLLLAVAYCVYAAWRSRVDEEARRKLLDAAYQQDRHTPPSAVSVAALRANYPDVAFYGSYAEMVAAWPPSPGDRPTPGNDPGFWDRP